MKEPLEKNYRGVVQEMRQASFQRIVNMVIMHLPSDYDCSRKMNTIDIGLGRNYPSLSFFQYQRDPDGIHLRVEYNQGLCNTACFNLKSQI